MYDRPETARANDRFWTSVRSVLGYGPATLTRNADVWDIWQSPDLLLAQTCGYPYRARLHGHVTLIGTPDYGIKDCPAGHYNSVFIARKDDTRTDLRDFHNATFAYNEPLSQSGWAAPMSHMNNLEHTFARNIQSGAHVSSAYMVANARADIAAIDAVTWAMIKRYDAFSEKLRVVTRTTPTPGLPYIAAMDADKTAVFFAVRSAIDTMQPADQNALQIRGIVDIPAAQYLAISTPAAPLI